MQLSPPLEEGNPEECHLNTNNHYNKKLTPIARNLRTDSTKAESRLWCDLLSGKNRQVRVQKAAFD